MNRKGWLVGMVVQAASAHGVEDVKVAGLLDAVADRLELICARQLGGW
jgi:hypothetical protein